MSPALLVAAIVALIIIVVFHKLLSYRVKRLTNTARQSLSFPPGPLLTVPFIGHLHYLCYRGCGLGRINPRPFHKTFFEWSQKYYGTILSVQLGEYNTVVINDYKLIKEVLNDTRFSGRPDFDSFAAISGGHKGISNGVHDTWMELRRLSLQNLKTIGMGKKSMDNLMHQEITELLEHLSNESQSDSENGKSVSSLQSSLDLVVLNILWTVVAGERLDQNDPTLASLLQKLKDVSKATEKTTVTFLPSIARQFPALSGRDHMIRCGTELQNFQKQLIQEHGSTLDRDNPRDFIDLFLIEMAKCDEKSSLYGSKGESQLIAVLNDLMVGGVLPTSAAMQWAILYLATHPDVQRELQMEIDDVVGRNCLPTMAARPRMPYAIAVLMETLRKSSIFPLGVFHATTEDIPDFYGYQIPRDTPICTNLWTAHHDPKVWGDPDNFRPERFLSNSNSNSTSFPSSSLTQSLENIKNHNNSQSSSPSNSNTVVENRNNRNDEVRNSNSNPNQNQNHARKLERHEASLPFSFGKRGCVGELLAKEQLFLFITSIFQRFNIQLSETETQEQQHQSDGDGIFSSELFEPVPVSGAMFLALPKSFSVLIKERD